MDTSFDLREVGSGIWMAHSRTTASAAVSNAALIDLGGRTMAVDALMTRRAAEELRAASMHLTGSAPFFVVNSHFHGDHIGGNRVFRDAPIAGTERMRELMAAAAPGSRGEYEAAANEARETARQLVSATNPSDEERETAAGLQALADALLEDEDGHRVVLPSVLIGDRLDLMGERVATLYSYGRGHTESDVIVHVPDAGVVVAGDLVWEGVHPKTDDGFPGDWAEGLRTMAQLEPQVVVPGHGPPATSDSVQVMERYVTEVADLVDRIAAGETTPDDAPVPPGSEQWAEVARFRKGLRALAPPRPPG